jgi:uncharacterized phage protein (TIGR01671 family)
MINAFSFAADEKVHFELTFSTYYQYADDDFVFMQCTGLKDKNYSLLYGVSFKKMLTFIYRIFEYKSWGIFSELDY